MAVPFLQLEAGDEPNTYILPITSELCVGTPGNSFMFGGIGLGAAMVAAEQALGRQMVWACAQFLSYATAADRLKLAVNILSAGRNVSQVHVRASTGDNTILNVSGALGARDGYTDDQWATAPKDMPAPDQCTTMQLWPKQDERTRFMDQLEVRLAAGRYGGTPRDGQRSSDGRLAMWMRMKSPQPVSSALLAIFADFVVSGVAAAFGKFGGGSSLDNTLRICRLVPTDWVLCDIKISAAARGFAHGDIQMYAEDGTLMATGGQSVMLRFAS